MGRTLKEKQPVGALPDLASLHERHPGVTPVVTANYAEAASVALSRHHESPTTFSIRYGQDSSERELWWSRPNSRAIRAWSNRDDATRDGAYSLALAAVEAEAGWVALGRAETRTGADYYVGFTDAPDYEDAYRLEVSGIDEGDAPQIEYRLTQKLKQAREGQSDLPALACVVGFRSRRIAIETAEEP